MMDKILPAHLYTLMYSCKIIVKTDVSMLPPWDAIKADVALFPHLTLPKIRISPATNKISEIITNDDLLIIRLQEMSLSFI